MFKKMTLTPDRHALSQGVSGRGSSGLVISTDAKPRVKWTPELHELFVEAVNQLGGANKATPKSVMRLMGINGLTLYHLKSHLQKYRIGNSLCGQPNRGGANRISMIRHATDVTHETDGPSNAKLIMQIEVMRRSHEQLEGQRHLQLRIEAREKYLQAVLEMAQETVGRQSLSGVGLNSAFSEIQNLSNQTTDCSINNSLMYSESKQIDHEVISLKTLKKL